MKKVFTIAMALTIAATTWAADAPKWLQKVRKAVVSVITYDSEGKMIGTGNGVIISPEGSAVADYSIFKGAVSAVAIDADGKQHPITNIEGANSMYEVIKFRIADAKKLTTIELAQDTVKANQAVFMLNYSTNKSQMPASGTITSKNTAAEKYSYYTLDFGMGEKNVGAPLLNEEGQLIALIQKADASEKNGYAIDANFAADLQISPLAIKDAALDAVKIKKSLPKAENDALLYIYMKQHGISKENLLELRSDFISSFPNSAEGYLQRAICLIDLDRNAEAENDLNKYQSLSQSKADALYNLSNIIYNKSIYRPEPAYKNWNLDEALTLINKAISIKDEPLYVSHRGAVLYAKKDYENAYNDFMAMASTTMRSANFFYSAAQCKENMNADAKEVLALKDSALACFSQPYVKDAAPYLYARAQQRVVCKMFRDAVIDFNEYEHLMNGQLNENFYYRREQAEVECRMFKQALDDINKAVEINPNDAELETERASINLRVGNNDEAESAAKHALELNEKETDAHRMLGYVLYKKGNKEEGLKHLNRAKELGDNTIDELINKLK